MSRSSSHREPLGKRVARGLHMAATIATLVSAASWGLARVDEIDQFVAGLLLLGASIGAGFIGLTVGLFVAAGGRAIRRANRRLEQLHDRDSGPGIFGGAPDQPALPPPDGWRAPPPPGQGRRLILWTLTPAAIVAIVGVVLIWEGDECRGAECDPRPGPTITIIETATPEPEETDEVSPTPDGGDASSTVALTPEEVEKVALSEDEIASVLELESYGEEDRYFLYDPISFELCSGVEVSTSDIGNDFSSEFNIGSYDDTAGSWVVSFEGAGAKEIMTELREGVDACGIRGRPGDTYGDDTVRLSKQLEDGSSWELIFFRRGSTVVEVASVAEGGDNAGRIEKLAAYADRSLLQVLDGA